MKGLRVLVLTSTKKLDIHNKIYNDNSYKNIDSVNIDEESKIFNFLKLDVKNLIEKFKHNNNPIKLEDGIVYYNNDNSVIM